jgi:hypothetical protein
MVRHQLTTIATIHCHTTTNNKSNNSNSSFTFLLCVNSRLPEKK